MGKVCEVNLRYLLPNWFERRERLNPNFHFLCARVKDYQNIVSVTNPYKMNMHNNTYYARASADGEIPVRSAQWRGSLKPTYRVSGLFISSSKKTELLRTAYRVHLREVISERSVKFAGKGLKAINRLMHTYKVTATW